ncbi:MAG TPA: tetratricopeptide repeat protein [Holophagaceae bacterium]|nr:tetratricopeptide repeat protein [Holophagaceae bacterium]
MAPDPYARYLQQAEELFSNGEIVRAGQIWQAVLRAVPDHGPARDGLFRVKRALDSQQAGQATTHLQAADIPVQAPALEEKAEEPTLVAPEAVIAASAPSLAAVMDEDTQEKLLREGCTLYDMGQMEDALKKWNQLLAAVPDHAMALEYARGARQEMGLPLEGPAPGSAPSDEPVTREVPAYGADEEAADKLLREGCLLYDMGLPEEAVSKWEQALKLAPHRSDIQSFLDNARKDMAAEQAPPGQGDTQAIAMDQRSTQAISAEHRPTLSIPAPEVSAADEKVRQAEHLLGLQRFEEASFTFQQALDLVPGHPGATAGLARSRAPRPAAPAPRSSSGNSGAVRIEMDRPEAPPEAPAQTPAAVQPPSALTKPAPAPRAGLQIKAPEALNPSNLPDWVKDPKVWGGAAAGVLVIILGTVWYQGYARDSQLQADVDAAHRAAVAKAARDAQVPSLAESATAILSEGQQALSQGDAVRAYLRAQTLLKKNPADGPAAQLLGKAKIALPDSTLVAATAEEYQRHLQGGDMDQAGKVMDALLRANPDDANLRAQAVRLYLRLAEAHASQDRWGDAQSDLLRGRALAPEDPAWPARLALLPKIQTMPKGDRALWIAMLG